MQPNKVNSIDLHLDTERCDCVHHN
jgi:hypothetical protein